MVDVRRLIKSDRWWGDKAAPVLAQVYLLLAIGPTDWSLGRTLLALGLFLLSFIGVAAYGHLVNDLGDLAHDARAGKANALAGRTAWQRRLLIGVALALGLAPWAWWPAPAAAAFAWLLVQLGLLTAYALPPLRLKTRSLAGVLTDALYAYTVPALICWSAWMATREHAEPPPLLLAALLTWTVFTGLRGILNHQLLDLDNDLRSGVQTLATRSGATATVRLLCSVVLPAEALAFALLTLVVSTRLPGYLPAAATVLLWRVFQLAYLWDAPLRWPWTLTPAVLVRDYGYRLLGDYYTQWFPVLTLLALVLQRPDHLPLLALHLLLFRSGPVNFFRHDLRWLPCALRKMMGRHG